MPGETLLGRGYSETIGGKGANQALASARLCPTAFVGRVGDDAAGGEIARALEAAGLRLTGLSTGEGDTGRAFISLTADGENSIVVLPLANAQLGADAVLSALDALAPRIVLTQCEVPAVATTAAAAWCRAGGARFAFNPSPVRETPEWVIALADPLIVNQSEAQTLAGTDSEDWDALALSLGSRARSVILTLGAEGAVIAEGGALSRVRGTPVTVVDTTGAGDAFAGTVVAHVARGLDLVRAAQLANEEASRIIQLARTQR